MRAAERCVCPRAYLVLFPYICHQTCSVLTYPLLQLRQDVVFCQLQQCYVRLLAFFISYADYNSTARNQKQSPLLRLPRELRDKIYDYVIGSGQISIQPLVDQCHLADRVYPHHELVPTIQLFTLSSICRQLHAETALLPFHQYSMILANTRASLTRLGQMSREQRAAIVQIDLRSSVLEDENLESFLADCHGLKRCTLRLVAKSAVNMHAYKLLRRIFGPHVHVNMESPFMPWAKEYMREFLREEL